MAGAVPEEKVDTPVAQVDWKTLTFLHWRFDPGIVQALLPDRLEVDVIDGYAWVGLTPFVMANFRAGPLPPIPKFSTFPETNLRTYVRGPDGRDGLWFLTLEVASLPTLVGARLGYGVPYHWADMSVDGDGTTITYKSRRRPPEDTDVMHDITIRAGEPFAPDELNELDHVLTGRWRAWTTVANVKLATAAVEHEPWSLYHAEVVQLEETIFTAAGLPLPEGEPLVHYSPGVSVKLGPPQPVG